MSKEAMTLALEALKKCEDALAEELSAWDIDPPLHHVQESHDLCGPAIKALEEALAKQEQGEPVAYANDDWSQITFPLGKVPTKGGNLYTTPQPAQKPWVGLTDDEMNEIWADQKRTGESITRAIEAKLKEKNT